MSEFKTAQDLRNLDVQVGRLLGFTVRTEAETGDLAFTNREWECEWIEDENGEEIELPRYSTKLECAWQLFASGNILFQVAWLQEPQHKVALNICLAFIRWHEKEKGT
jgi:hypothetical protein